MTTIDHPYAKPKIAKQSPFDGSPDVQIQSRSGYRSARRYRARVVLFAFGLFSAAFAAIIVLRIVVRLPMSPH
ncbi:MAG TPA: hypothetical protein VEC94_03875 [Pseudolabrys sp.]|nr:hypothetical protein [Pseudolabrys sp.]